MLGYNSDKLQIYLLHKLIPIIEILSYINNINIKYKYIVHFLLFKIK